MAHRIMDTLPWTITRWGLTSCFQMVTLDPRVGYDEAKKVILERVRIDEEKHSQHFRLERLQPNEDPRSYYYRVQYLEVKWLCPETHSLDEILKTIVQQQFLEGLPTPMQRWVRQNSNLDLRQALDLSTAYA